MSSQLTVYKASAGSGKTFTLAREYMTLVIANPASYRTILAVTFTNKATEEMKMRILGKLYRNCTRTTRSKRLCKSNTAGFTVSFIQTNSEKCRISPAFAHT
ncbi:MAG: UvrD-helicase domain-containing protein [Segatella copri]